MAPASGTTSTSSGGGSRSLLYALVVTIAVVAAAAALYVSTAKESPSSSGAADSTSKKSPSPTKSAPPAAASVVVEDGSDSDDDEDSEEEEEEDEEEESEEAKAEKAAQELKRKEAEELAKRQKEEYDNYVSVANKCINGKVYARAAENYTKALELAPLVASAKGQLLSIYNNRSACFEKSEEHAKAMNDIDIVLAMDPLHVKARVRRARILEVREAYEPAMVEYVCAGFIDRNKGDQSNLDSYEAKMTELGKLAAVKSTSQTLDAIRASPPRVLPPNGYCRNFFEILPITHSWRASLSAKEGLDELSSRLQRVQKLGDGDVDADAAAAELVEAAVNVAACAIADGKFKLAFKALATLKAAPLDKATPAVAALAHLLLGLEEHVRCGLDRARPLYEAAIAKGDLPDAKLALASLLRELGDEAKALDMYDAILGSQAKRLGAITGVVVEGAGAGAELEEGEVEEGGQGGGRFAAFLQETAGGGVSIQSPEAIAREFAQTADASLAVQTAWTLLHRHSLWTMRGASGAYRPNCLVLSQQDLAVAGSLLESIVSGAVPLQDAALKAEAGMALATHCIRQVSLITQTKSAVTGGSAPLDDEEKSRCRQCLERAKGVAPQNESVLILETEILSMDERMDDALVITEKLLGLSDSSDGVPIVIKANLVTHQALVVRHSLEEAPQGSHAGLVAKAEGLFKEAEDLYSTALERDPLCLEALVQAAQLKSLVGKFDESRTLLERALPLSRTREEVMEVGQMLVMSRAKADGIAVLQQYQQ